MLHSIGIGADKARRVSENRAQLIVPLTAAAKRSVDVILERGDLSFTTGNLAEDNRPVILNDISNGASELFVEQGLGNWWLDFLSINTADGGCEDSDVSREVHSFNLIIEL